MLNGALGFSIFSPVLCFRIRGVNFLCRWHCRGGYGLLSRVVCQQGNKIYLHVAGRNRIKAKLGTVDFSPFKSIRNLGDLFKGA